MMQATTQLSASDLTIQAVQIVSAAAAAGAAIAAFTQSRLTKSQLDNTMRPWISLEYGGIGFTPDRVLTIPLQNYGQLPAINFRVKLFSDGVEFTEEKVLSREYTPGHAVIVPNGKRRATITLADQSVSMVLSGATPLYVGVWAEYEYGDNKKGEYFLIGKYNFRTGYDETIVERVK